MSIGIPYLRDCTPAECYVYLIGSNLYYLYEKGALNYESYQT